MQDDDIFLPPSPKSRRTMAGTTSMTDDELDHKTRWLGHELRGLAFPLAHDFSSSAVELEELRSIVSAVKVTYEALNAIVVERDRREITRAGTHSSVRRF